MQRNILPELTLHYKLIGKRNKNRPRKRWEDQFLDDSWCNRLHKQTNYFRKKKKNYGLWYNPELH